VTVPLGVPLPGETTASENVTTTGWPTTLAVGVRSVIVVVVVASFTGWFTGVELLPAKFVPPAYVAVTLFEPVEWNVTKQFPAATVAVQLSVPSDTVTLPVGVPDAGATAITV
jgi:hypothetical protein